MRLGGKILEIVKNIKKRDKKTSCLPLITEFDRGLVPP